MDDTESLAGYNEQGPDVSVEGTAAGKGEGCFSDDQLSALLYGAYSVEEVAAMREHIAICPSCRKQCAVLATLNMSATAESRPSKSGMLLKQLGCLLVTLFFSSILWHILLCAMKRAGGDGM